MTTTAGSGPISPTSPAGAPVVARKINREIVLLAGWGPAILLQFAHPLVAMGVAEHSTFRSRPGERMRRLRKTVSAMLALTFGTPDEVQRAADGINAIHDRVHGRLGETRGGYAAGAAYSAHDPELLRWVHATLLDMLPRTYELFVGPLSAVEKDRYCLEASGVAPLLGIPDRFLPTGMAELREYLAAMYASGEIEVGETARQLAGELLWPPMPAVARPFIALNRLAAIGLLPPHIRTAYGFRWDARRARALRLGARACRGVMRVTPPLLRHWPMARRADLTP